jgi:acyl-CoA thioesterase
MTDIEKVRELFAKDRYATDNGMVIDEIGDHYAKCSVELNENHLNAMGAVMGGVHFTLADFAFAVASNWQEPGVVGLDCNISYLSTVKGKRLIAEAHLVKDGRTTCCYNVSVSDSLGNPVAAVKVVGFHTVQ